MAFYPAVLTVARGDTVVWINQDIVPHTATARRPRWDTGPLTRGQDGRYVARHPGAVPYLCTLHPTMQGKVIIQ